MSLRYHKFLADVHKYNWSMIIQAMQDTDTFHCFKAIGLTCLEFWKHQRTKI